MVPTRLIKTSNLEVSTAKGTSFLNLHITLINLGVT